MNVYTRALQYFRPDTARAGWAAGILVLSTGLALLKPWPLAVIVDSVLEGEPLPAVLTWAAGWDKSVLIAVLAGSILLLHAGQGAFTALQNYISIGTGLRGLARVRNRLFARLQRLSLSFHHGSHQGDVIYRASWDTYAFQTLFQQGLFTLIQASLTLVLMAGVMWQLNRRLTGLTLMIVPLLLLTMRCFGRQIKKRSLAAHQADSRLTSFVQQTIVAIPIIQAYARERDEERRFAEYNASSLVKRTAQHGWEVSYWFVVALVFGLAAAILTGYGAGEVLAARLSVGELLVFLAYLTQLYDPLNQLSHVGATVSEASAGVQRVFELLDTPETVADRASARPIMTDRERDQQTRPAWQSVELAAPRERRDLDSGAAAALVLKGEVRFENVSFCYQPDRSVLNHVSFTVPAKTSAALIGPSGAGKTTLLQLLPRFYDPSSGAIRLDGVDLRDLRLADLRQNIALALQEAILLPATIAENIAYGRPDSSPDRIHAAARAAHADEFIRKLSREYDTVVGEGGARLSAGERQRISLARAFLKDAPILVLDEPTSALDAESQSLIIASLTELIRNRTTLIVAHRLSTIRSVDMVFVMESGTLIESGTHQDLTERSGYYSRVMAGSDA